MPEGLMRAKRFRQYAEALRTIAEGWENADTLRGVIDLAREFDEMADDLEQSAKADGMELPP